MIPKSVRIFGAVMLAIAAAAARAPAAWAVPAVPAASATPAASAAPAAAADGRLDAFSARYEAEWKGIKIGTSDLELKEDSVPGRYVYIWTITARGIFRMYRDKVTQQSWLGIDAGHVRPERYRAEDGAATVSLNFDWNARRVRGTSEKKPVDLPLDAGTQDIMSIQVEVMLDLKKGDLPAAFRILDGDEVKEFAYSKEGTARIKTVLGELDTVIVASRRDGNNRILRMWFAPALGYVPVQAERFRDGKSEFAMRIKTLKR